MTSTIHCSRCGGPALATLATGGLRESLCLRCAERGAGIVGLSSLAVALDPGRSPAEACPHCGTTQAAARRTGLAGCPLCYTALTDIWPSLGAPERYAAENPDL